MQDTHACLAATLRCDHCAGPISTERAYRYDRNPNHVCAEQGHYCSVECYDIATGARDYR